MTKPSSWIEQAAIVFAIIAVCAIVTLLRHAQMLPGVLKPKGNDITEGIRTQWRAVNEHRSNPTR